MKSYNRVRATIYCHFVQLCKSKNDVNYHRFKRIYMHRERRYLLKSDRLFKKIEKSTFKVLKLKL